LKSPDETTGGFPFKLSTRKAVSVSSQDIVTTGYLDPERMLPLVVRALRGDTDLSGWAKANLPLIASELLRCGAVLFRGFAVTRADQFQKFVSVVSGESIPYREQTSPRTRVADNVYTSTDYPMDQSILPHNENSYAITFPRKLYFWCETPAQRGGQTPLCDTRKVLASISEPVVEKFMEKGWMYVRNFNPHFGLSWQMAFQTEDRAEVECYCRESAIEWEWTPAGLRTRQVRPAIARHPETGEAVWFNHAMFFHVSNVEPNLRARLLAQYDERDLPNNTYYGDGSQIEDSVVQHLLAAYRSQSVSFLWEPGDIVLIDNMLTAHAREPFVGARRILVAMAEPYTRDHNANSHIGV
jgi:alpha-ketoglutarate-dependent taurine dioxygenase